MVAAFLAVVACIAGRSARIPAEEARPDQAVSRGSPLAGSARAGQAVAVDSPAACPTISPKTLIDSRVKVSTQATMTSTERVIPPCARAQPIPGDSVSRRQVRAWPSINDGCRGC
jgi:hypothetical protein